jgi:hypothetical protein
MKERKHCVAFHANKKLSAAFIGLALAIILTISSTGTHSLPSTVVPFPPNVAFRPVKRANVMTAKLWYVFGSHPFSSWHRGRTR